jgi:hypothetical protein
MSSTAMVNTPMKKCTSPPARGISKDKLTQYLRAFQPDGIYIENGDKRALKRSIRAILCEINNVLHKSVISDYAIIFRIIKSRVVQAAQILRTSFGPVI